MADNIHHNSTVDINQNKYAFFPAKLNAFNSKLFSLRMTFLHLNRLILENKTKKNQQKMSINATRENKTTTNTAKTSQISFLNK